MALIKSFRELDVYGRAIRESKRLFVRTKQFPREETYSLTSQIRRSSRAVGSMLAEAWARRRYPAAFVNKVDEALGECMETQAWLDHALECDYISRAELSDFDDKWQRSGGMLNRMIERSDTFCTSISEKR